MTRWQRLAWVAVVLAAVVPYLPTLDNYFMQDDFGVVRGLWHRPWSYIPRWFWTPWLLDVWGYTSDEIRPFPALTYWLATMPGPATPWPNHVINIAFHAVNALLVASVARRAAGLGLVSSSVAGIVFAVLPMQTESVAWITGRVDSMPACLFVAAFLMYAKWRGEGHARDYWWSVALCFLALFSKQNTVTLGPTVLLYDLIVVRRGVQPTWRWVRPYVPFIVLTAGYLVLRFALFGEVAREGSLNAHQFQIFASDLSVHLRRMVFGEDGLRLPIGRAAAYVGAAMALVAAVGVVSSRQALANAVRPAAFFGIIWIGLSIAPTIVAGYASPRHMYLASFGWALVAGLGFDVWWRGRPERLMRIVSAGLAAMLLVSYVTQLRADVRLWGVRAAVSRKAADDLEREAMAAPQGTLFITGAPGRSWNFSLPHAVRPPFAAIDVTERVGIVSHSMIYCCPAHVWEPDMRATLRAWLARDDRPPVVALHWDPTTGDLSRLSDREEPYLRVLVQVLLDSPDVATLDRHILDITERLVRGRRP